MSGIELCERIVRNRPDVPVVVFTAFGSFETAVAAIRAGAVRLGIYTQARRWRRAAGAGCARRARRLTTTRTSSSAASTTA